MAKSCDSVAGTSSVGSRSRSLSGLVAGAAWAARRWGRGTTARGKRFDGIFRTEREGASSEECLGDEVEASLYERLGGDETVKRLVEGLHRRCEADGRFARFLAPSGLSKLALKHRIFATALLGGPFRYEGRGVNAIHRRLVERQGLNGTHFDAFVEHLTASLEEISVPRHLAKEVIELCESWRDCVLSLGEWS